MGFNRLNSRLPREEAFLRRDVAGDALLNRTWNIEEGQTMSHVGAHMS
jgi:hypothetical protein